MADLLRDRYELLEVLGEGGEGRVVKALDHQHDRFVALKIRTVHAGDDREALLSEARVLLAIPPHPHLPLVRDDFFDGDQYVIAMDWVEGDGPRPPAARPGPPGARAVGGAPLARRRGRGPDPPPRASTPRWSTAT